MWNEINPRSARKLARRTECADSPGGEVGAYAAGRRGWRRRSPVEELRRCVAVTTNEPAGGFPRAGRYPGVSRSAWPPAECRPTAPIGSPRSGVISPHPAALRFHLACLSPAATPSGPLPALTTATAAGRWCTRGWNPRPPVGRSRAGGGATRTAAAPPPRRPAGAAPRTSRAAASGLVGRDRPSAPGPPACGSGGAGTHEPGPWRTTSRLSSSSGAAGRRGVPGTSSARSASPRPDRGPAAAPGPTTSAVQARRPSTAKAEVRGHLQHVEAAAGGQQHGVRPVPPPCARPARGRRSRPPPSAPAPGGSPWSGSRAGRR